MEILKTLKIKPENFGSCSGPSQWNETKNEGIIESINPANGELISSVYQCSIADYDSVVKQSLEVQKEWRKVPAPERGNLVRKMGNALRDYNDPLGSLVSLEMGKIKQEGDCLLYTSPSPRDQRGSRMPSSA